VLPTRSVAVVDGLEMPLVDTSVGLGWVATPEPPESVAVHVTVTSLLFQPGPLGAGEKDPVTVGAVLSRVNDADLDVDWPVHLPCGLTLGAAAAVIVWLPLPLPAVSGKVHDVFGVLVCCAVNAPDSSTHSVSLDVVTVSVRAPPCLAYNTLLKVAVPDPPARATVVTDEALAGTRMSPAHASGTAIATVPHRRHGRADVT
jgi:hypothetical protein